MSFFTGTYFGKLIMTFFMSMVPVIELRGAIPVAVGYGLDPYTAAIVAVIGNLVPVPFIIVFIRKIFEILRKYMPRMDRVISRLEKRAEEKGDVVRKSQFWGLFILVAIPLPGTGAWTGALVAAILNMQLKRAIPPIVLGVVTAGIVVLLVTKGAFHVFG